MKWYGNVDHIAFVIKFQERDRKARHPQPNRYGRTVAAVVREFGCAEGSAKAAIAGLAAYRMDVLATTQPAETAALLEDFRRLAEKAEQSGDLKEARQNRREIGKICGSYAPIKVEVSPGLALPATNIQHQLQAMYAVLDERDRADLERILGNVERAKLEGRLQLPSGDDDEPAPPDDEDDEPVADAVIVGEATAP